MRGAPHSGFSRLILRISWRVSTGTLGRPRRPRRDFHAQKRRKPFRCQPMTVSGLTIIRAERQPRQVAANHAHRNRSEAVSFGRLIERCRTVSWWRRASTSICRDARLRMQSRAAAKTANNTEDEARKETKINSQRINQIRICENHTHACRREHRQTAGRRRAGVFHAAEHRGILECRHAARCQ